jgi:hypothetical protein
LIPSGTVRVNCCEWARADTTNEEGNTSFSMAYLEGEREGGRLFRSDRVRNFMECS